MHALTTSLNQTGLDTSLNKTGLGTSFNQTGLGTTMISSKNGSRELLNTNTSSMNVFHPAVGSASLRHTSHKYSFPKSRRLLNPNESFTSVRPSRNSADTFYDLNSTISKEAITFTKGPRDKTL